MEAKARADRKAKERALKPGEHQAGEDPARHKTDFVVTEDGTAVPVSQSRMREGFERAGFPEQPRSLEKPEPGQIHRVPTPYGPIDVRTMEGSSHHRKRAVFTRPDSNDPVKPDGSRWRANTPRDVRKDHSHLPQED